MLAAAPSGIASWSVNGQTEPNSQLDHPSWMFTDPDRSGSNKVFFNGLLIHAYTGANPNLGALGGSLVVPGQQFAFAYLGLWRDCNGDGYVGLAESVLLEYRVESLWDDSICPAQAPTPERAFYPNNDGEWVREFLWIGWGNNAANPQGRAVGVVNDSDALVWADDGLPSTESFVGCPLNPPRGTFSSTGGLIAWADCYGKRRILATVAPALALGNLAGLDLDFENQEFPQCSESDANVRLDIFYRDPRCPADRVGLLEPRTHKPGAVVWNCDDQLTVTDLEDRELYSIPRVREDVRLDTEASLYDGASHLAGGLEGQCSHAGGSSIDAVYVSLHPEQPFVATTVKRETTFAFEFHNDRAGSYLGRIYEDPRMPANLGITAVNNAGVLPLVGGARLGPGWQSQVTRFEGPPLLRDDLADPQAAPPGYYTFYAYVGVRTRDLGVLLPGAEGQYGAGWCGENDSGIHLGADCDVTHWWSEEHGASAMPTATWTREPIGVHLGQTYQLRDIDCVDNEVAARSGIYLSTAYLSNPPCQ